MSGMSFLEKKVYILRLVPLGVDLFSACVEVKCTQEEIDLLEDDDDFQSELRVAKSMEKTRLIRLYKDTAERAADKKDDYNGVRNYIKDMYPEAFGGSSDNNKEDKVEFYLPSNGRGDDI